MADRIENTTTEQLEKYLERIKRELKRREILNTAAEKVNSINVEVLKAKGLSLGDPWRQPSGAHDAYPINWEVVHKGNSWVSLIEGNVFEPGLSGWRVEASDTPAPWVKPSGAHDAYRQGDIVLFNSKKFKSLIEGNVWSPEEYPDGWKLLPSEEEK